MSSRRQNQLLTQLSNCLHLIAIAIDVQHHLTEHRSPVGQQTTRARGILVPKHVGGGNLHSQFVLGQLQPLGISYDLLEQSQRLLLQLGLLFLLLLRIGGSLRGRGWRRRVLRHGARHRCQYNQERNEFLQHHFFPLKPEQRGRYARQILA